MDRFPADLSYCLHLLIGFDGVEVDHGGRLTYDAAGNVTSDSRAAGTYVYAYDVAGRLSSSVTLGGVLQASYLYDYQGRQAVRTLGA